jgi:hypothetical protein
VVDGGGRSGSVVVSSHATTNGMAASKKARLTSGRREDPGVMEMFSVVRRMPRVLLGVVTRAGAVATCCAALTSPIRTITSEVLRSPRRRFPGLIQ